MDQNRKIIYADDLMVAIRDDYNINSSAFAAMVRHINAAPAVEIKTVIAAPTFNEATVAALERMGANAHRCAGNVETMEVLYGSSPCTNLPHRKEAKE